MDFGIYRNESTVCCTDNDRYLSNGFVVANDFVIELENYGKITIPRGTLTSHSKNDVRLSYITYVSSFDWCKDNPKLKESLLNDPFDIPVHYLTHVGNIVKLNNIEKLHSKLELPRVGDCVLRSDGGYYQIMDNDRTRWGNKLDVQLRPSSCENNEGYFYIHENGGEGSGSCGDLIPRKSLVLTNEVRSSQCWFFCQANGKGQTFSIKVRVYKEQQ